MTLLATVHVEDSQDDDLEDDEINLDVLIINTYSVNYHVYQLNQISAKFPSTTNIYPIDLNKENYVQNENDLNSMNILNE